MPDADKPAHEKLDTASKLDPQFDIVAVPQCERDMRIECV
jgi:hypothetical protein